MKHRNHSLTSLTILSAIVLLGGCSSGPVIEGPVGALSQIRMQVDGDPEGKARGAFPSGTTTVWCAFHLHSSLADAVDRYSLNVVDSSGNSLAQVVILEEESITNAGSMVIGGPTTPYKVTVPIELEDGSFADGEYRLQVMHNELCIATLPWSVGN